MAIVHYASGPHINVESDYWLYDHLIQDGYEVRPYYIYRYGHSRDFYTKIHQYLLPFKILLNSRKGDFILLYDITTTFICLGFFVWLFGLDRKIVAVNFMGSGSTNGYSKKKKFLIKRALSVERVGVNNEKLIELYMKEFSLSRKNFFIIKDCIGNVDLSEKDTKADKSNYVFMGGNVHRDWKMLTEIVREMSDVQFCAVLGTDELDAYSNLSNLKIFKKISLTDFNKLVAHCKIVFLPLTTEIQAGQLVAFQGSVYKKPLIITKSLGIDTYYSDDDVIKVNAGDRQACVNAISSLLVDDSLCNQYAERGFNKLMQLSPTNIYNDLKEEFPIE